MSLPAKERKKKSFFFFNGNRKRRNVAKEDAWKLCIEYVLGAVEIFLLFFSFVYACKK